jgi:hypothetical protein
LPNARENLVLDLEVGWHTANSLIPCLETFQKFI